MVANTGRHPLAPAILISLLFVSSALAQDDWDKWTFGDKFNVHGGFFLPSLDTTVRVTDPNGFIGTRISFEQNLGLDDNKGTALIGLKWRFAKRHSMHANYFSLSRSGASSTGVTVSIGDREFNPNLPVQSFFDIEAVELGYSYSLIFDRRKEFFVGIGLSVQSLDLGLVGTEQAPNPGATIDVELDSAAPLPTLNVGFNYALTDNWAFRSQLGWLAVSAEFEDDRDISGSILNGYVGMGYRLADRIAAYLNYQFFDVDATYEKGFFVYDIVYDYNGPVLGLAFAF